MHCGRGPEHWWQPYSGTTTYWSPGDSQELWETNMRDPTQRVHLERLGWTDPYGITYSHNAQGFRDSELDDRPAGMAFGCSMTYGTGLPVNRIWPSLLGRLLGFHVWNFGIPGVGYDTVFRMMHHWVPVIRPRLVVVFEPPTQRIEIKADHDRWSTITSATPDPPWDRSEFVRMWYSFEENTLYNTDKNRRACRDVCSELSISFFSYPNEGVTRIHWEDKDVARDLQHPGIGHHDRLAGLIASDIKSRLGL